MDVLQLTSESLLVIKESILAVLLSRQIVTIVVDHHSAWVALCNILVLLSLTSIHINHEKLCYIMITRLVVVVTACVLLKYMQYANEADAYLNYPVIILTNQLPRVLTQLRARLQPQF